MSDSNGGTRTFSIYPIVGAVMMGQDVVGVVQDWDGINKDQRRLIEEFLPAARGELTHIPEMQALASSSPGDVSSFLSEHGFSGHASAETRADVPVLHLVAILSVSPEWRERGGPCEVNAASGGTYKGVRLQETSVSFYQSDSHPDPIACINTKSFDRVFVTPFEVELAKNDPAFGLLDAAQRIEATLTDCHDFGELIIPKVVFQSSGTVDWLVGMGASVGALRSRVASATMGTRVGLDEGGIEVTTYAHVEIPLAAPSPLPPFVIDRPFLLWVSRGADTPAFPDPLVYPLFVGYFAEDSWV